MNQSRNILKSRCWLCWTLPLASAILVTVELSNFTSLASLIIAIIFLSITGIASALSAWATIARDPGRLPKRS